MRSDTPIPADVARAARELRAQRRTASGRRWRPWRQIADELRRQGLGRFDPRDLAAAVGALPIEEHALAPTSRADLEAIERSFRDGWAVDFPGEPWPGLAEARRRLGEMLTDALREARP